jgi:magnesium chelatase accessory protein
MLARIPGDWPHRKSSREVSAGGFRWHVQVAGRGPALLLLHGSGSSAHSWADVVPALTGRSTVVVPDLPGHGFTTGGGEDSLSLPRIAGALDALIRALNVGPVQVVAGHSAGAALAVAWALQGTRPPRAIVGFNPSLVPPLEVYTRYLAAVVTPVATSALGTTLLAGIARRARLVEGLLASTRSSIPAAQRVRYERLFGDPAHVRGTMRFMAAADLARLNDHARSLAIPTTFVLGSRDHWVPERHLRPILARCYPNATVCHWEGGHLLHEVEPGRAAEFIVARMPAGAKAP